MGFCRGRRWRMRGCLLRRGSGWSLRRWFEIVVTIAKDNSEKLGEELRVSQEFLAKYNRPGPRYTSYPTAPVWNDAFGPDDLERVHEASDRVKAPVSLYMHLPFCESLCLFCACNVIIQKDHGVTKPYLAVLKQELA